MSRWAVPVLFAVTMTGAAFAADNAPPLVRRHAATQLPSGLPRAHYKYRTTVADQPPYAGGRLYVRPRPADPEPDVLFTPTDDLYAPLPDVRPLISRPFLPGSSALPGYYGSSTSYYYQGPYYGGPNPAYWTRLPYACGVLGYC